MLNSQIELWENLKSDNNIIQVQEYIKKVIELRGFSEQNVESTMLLLTEEIGELAKEIRKSRKYFLDTSKNNEVDVEGEIADVFIYVLSMCRVMNVNLIDAFKNKEEKNCKREWK